MSLPELVTIHTSLLTDLGDAVRERFGVSGELTIEEMTETVTPSLPDTYQQVDYIESHGGQYIQLDHYPDKYSRIVADMQFTQLSSSEITQYNGTASGADYYPTSASVYWGVRTSQQDFALMFSKAEDNALISVKAADTERHIWDLQNGSQKFDGTEVGQTTLSANGDGAIYKMRIFCFNPTWSTSVRYCYEKLYSLKIYRNGSLYSYFIPCYRKSDKVIGLYDAIYGKFYTNAGSGSFTCYPSPT